MTKDTKKYAESIRSLYKAVLDTPQEKDVVELVLNGVGKEEIIDKLIKNEKKK